MDNLQPGVMQKLLKELKSLQQDSIDGVKLIINESNVADIQAEYDGPAGTPFEGGLFRMKLVLGPDFPNAPPKGYFLTKLFHPNVSSDGDICVNVLKRDWKPDLGLRHILTVIRCLLIEPNPESALNEEAGKLLLDSFEDFAKKARLMTEIHAKKPSILTATGGANALNATETSGAGTGAAVEVKNGNGGGGADGSRDDGNANTVNGGAASGGGSNSSGGAAVKHKLSGRPAGVDKKKSLRRL